MEQVINLLVDQVKSLRMEIKYDNKEMRETSASLKKELSELNVKLSVMEAELKTLKEQKPLISFPNTTQGWIKILLILAATGILPSGVVNAAVKVIASDIAIEDVSSPNVVKEGE